MPFYNWTTCYSLSGNRKQRKNYSVTEYYQHIISEMMTAGHYPARQIAEKLWIECGSPYYNIHPQLTASLCKTNLQKIPATMLKIPHELQCVHVRFSKEHSEFFDGEDTVHSFLMSLHESKVLFYPESGKFGKVLHLILDFGKFDRGLPKQQEFRLELFEDQSIDEAINSTKKLLAMEGMIRMDGTKMPTSEALAWYENGVFENLMRLAVTIGFLADNPTICEADVLNEDQYKFRHGNEEQKRVLSLRAKNRNKYGYNIGTELMFLGERPKLESQNSIETGRELEYAHIRGGHPHAVRYGEDKKLVKIMWFPPLTVRADLPFKSHD